MRVLRSDYKVTFRNEAAIENHALNCRRAAGACNSAYFNIIDFVESALRTILRKLKKGELRISLFDSGPDDKPALVTFNPAALHVDREIWKLAKIGDPDARYIIAHEVGHLILHDNDAKAFSSNAKDQISFELMNEYSAEWQANVFASHFLLPSHIVAAVGCEQRLVNSCGVTAKLARDRLATIEPTRYSGNACSECGNFTIRPKGTHWKCYTCGFSEPIFSRG